MDYEANDKHKFPWQRGARGSLCPSEIGQKDAQALLDDSQLSPKRPGKRYATDGERAYCAMEHSVDKWHGYPVGWKEVPTQIRMQWLAEGKIDNRAVKSFWDSAYERRAK